MFVHSAFLFFPSLPFPSLPFPSFAMSSIPSLHRKFRLFPMPRDGNCLFRAVARVYHQDEDMHLLLRRSLMEHIMEDKHAYEPLFFGPRSFDGALMSGRQKGVWNPDLSGVIMSALADYLCVTLESYHMGDDGSTLRRSVFAPSAGASASPRIRLLFNETMNHCDLLLV
jgi:hypothetical protein